MVGMKKAATDAVCGGFTPPLLQTTRGAAVQSTENDDKATPTSDALQLLRIADSLGSGAEFEVDGVDALTRHIDALTAALAAERDRADRLAVVLEEVRVWSVAHGYPGTSEGTLHAILSKATA